MARTYKIKAPIASIACIVCLVQFYAFVLPASAQSLVTVMNNGEPQNRVDIAILGDGYTSDEMGKYATDVQQAINGIFMQQPFAEYQRYFNVHRVEVISSESGADHPERYPAVFKNTAFDATYNCSGIQRLICVNTSEVLTVASNVLSPAQRDIILVIVNDPEYGGSGGTVAVASTNSLVVELVLHEEGHSLGLLGDEYGGPPPPSCNTSVEPSAPNITMQTQRDLIKWANWIEPATPIPTTQTLPGVPGLYQGAQYCDQLKYRPTYSSKMRTTGTPFEQINTEQLVKRFYNWVSPLDTITPLASDVTISHGLSQTFSITTPLPLTHTLDASWFVDGQLKAGGFSFTFDSSSIPLGMHTVEVKVEDNTNMVRNDPAEALQDGRSWNVNITTPAGGARADFNNDTKPDILWRSVSTGENYVWYLDGVTVLGGVSLPAVADQNWNVVGVADFNNEGRPDILWRSASTGENYVWYLDGVTVLGGGSLPTVADQNWNVIGAEDFNNDGKPDILWRRASTGENYVWYLDGVTVLGGVSLPAVADQNWRLVGVADFNNDNKTDILWRNTSTGENYVWYLDGVTVLGGVSLPTVSDQNWTIVP